MSETTETAPQGGGAAAPEPAAPETEATAPATEGAATETEQPEHKPAGDEGDPAAKRIARLTARYAQTARERDELASRIAQLEARQRDGGAQPDADTEALINARAEQIANVTYTAPTETGEAETIVDAQTAGQRSAAADVPRVGRNDPCPCGSGQKYKQCHGKLA